MATKQKQDRKQTIKERAATKAKAPKEPTAKGVKDRDDYEAAKADAYRLENEGKWDEACIAWGVVIDFATTTKDKKMAVGRKGAAKVRASAAAKALEEQMEAQMARDAEAKALEREVAEAQREPEADANEVLEVQLEPEAVPTKYALDGEVIDIDQILASKTILNGIAISDSNADAIPHLSSGCAISIETELSVNFILRCEERALTPDGSETTKRYTIEGDEINLEQFIEFNAAPRGALTADTIERLRALTPGNEVDIATGTVEYTVRCEAAAIEVKPKSAKSNPAPKTPGQRDSRLPPVGTVIVKRDRAGTERAHCTVVEGGIEYKGARYKSLSAAGLKAMADLGLKAQTCDGFAFWGLKKGEARPATKGLDFEQIEKAWNRYHMLIEQAAKVEDAGQRAKINEMIAKHASAMATTQLVQVKFK